MAIRVKMPASGVFSAQDLFGIIDFISVDASLTGFSATSFSGTGAYRALPASFSASGTGFSTGLIGGDTYIVTGTVDQISFTSGGQTVLFNNVNIPMATFSAVIFADESGANPTAIEDFLQARPWNITLGNGDDVATATTVVSQDGAVFNLLNNDVIRGQGGNDNLFSGSGNDLLDGGRGDDILNGGDGRDRLYGDRGRDTLQGGRQSDKLYGEESHDRLFGGNGNDQLDGGVGNDFLAGGRGSDIFIFRDGYGNDRIKGFDSKDANEDIDLRGVTNITSFADLTTNHMTQVGAHVVIDDFSGTRITVLNVQISDMDGSHFLF